MKTTGWFKILVAGCLSFVNVTGQGQQCTVPSDCTSEYAPYCSKWGWCVWTSLYGDEGPPQSFGAEEDGERGQCRTDKDCTKWAPICSPLGYCRSGFWDGSFGSPSNPRPGQEPSQWIKDNAAKFRTGTKENPNPNNVRTGGQADRKKGVSTTSGKSSGGARSPNSNNGSRPASRKNPRKSSESQRGANKAQYDEQISAGQIPGVAGKDYPNYSISSLRNKHKNIEAAPKDKIPKNYPNQRKTGQGNRNKNSSGGRSTGQSKNSQSHGPSGGQAGKGCPGSLDQCMAACPSDLRTFKACVASCGRRCKKK